MRHPRLRTIVLISALVLVGAWSFYLQGRMPPEPCTPGPTTSTPNLAYLKRPNKERFEKMIMEARAKYGTDSAFTCDDVGDSGCKVTMWIERPPAAYKGKIGFECCSGTAPITCGWALVPRPSASAR